MHVPSARSTHAAVQVCIKLLKGETCMQAFTRGMQWCCAAGEWDLPYQFDLARWGYIQPRFLVRTLYSSLMQSRTPIYRPSWNGGAE